MKNIFESEVSQSQQQQYVQTGAASKFMQQVYIIMSLGLGMTAAAAWFTSGKFANGEWMWLQQNFMLVAFAPIIFVLILSFRIEKMSYETANIVFALYSLLNGVALAPIFLVYTGASIAKTFIITAGTFGVMALVGATTKVDLSKYRSIFFMALIGLIIAMVANWFLGSSTIDYIISAFGVLLFCGLTAYDTQTLIQIGAHADVEQESTRKIALMGALSLYLDFINLFLFLLRFLGSRD